MVSPRRIHFMQRPIWFVFFFLSSCVAVFLLNENKYPGPIVRSDGRTIQVYFNSIYFPYIFLNCISSIVKKRKKKEKHNIRMAKGNLIIFVWITLFVLYIFFNRHSFGAQVAMNWLKKSTMSQEPVLISQWMLRVSCIERCLKRYIWLKKFQFVYCQPYNELAVLPAGSVFLSAIQLICNAVLPLRISLLTIKMPQMTLKVFCFLHFCFLFFNN